jgi:short-subunit dehydrogenase involved in D-alanine esterification of teichoic acids
MSRSKEKSDNLPSQLIAVPHVLNINWKVPESIQTLHATNVIIQQRGTEFHLHFFEVIPPIVAGTPQEQAQAYQKMESVDGICVARIVLSLENMQNLIQSINESMNNFQEQIRYLEQLSKEQNDDASNH